MNAKQLRLFSLFSAVGGLCTYALSSSFNRLLGNWSWWKMLIYIVFSFIICLAVLFAPARSSSTTSLRLEAHLSFLVLIITSAYSFLLDNVMTGFPDIGSLMSCFYFGMMSVGLSNLTQFGFQIDLLYFFCGSLILQLMKIKLWLVIVGIYISVSFHLFRYIPIDTQAENLQLPIQNPVIVQVDDSEIVSNSGQLRDYPRHTQAENLQLQIQNPVSVQVDDSEIVSNSGPATVMSQQANADLDSTVE